jgi:hypothetical protein
MGKLIDGFKEPKTKLGQYLLNNFIAWDQMWNARLGGDPDETVSSRLGKLQAQPGGIPRYRIFSRFMAKFLNTIDNDHCDKAVESDEGSNAIVDKTPERACWSCKKLAGACTSDRAKACKDWEPK